jgi:hypothetical protein
MVAVLPLALLAGCGGSSGNHSDYPSVTGNWDITLVSGNQSLGLGGLYSLGGTIANQGGVVSGTLHAADDPNLGTNCFPGGAQIPITGSVTPSGSLTLTSSPVDGQSLSITGLAISGIGNPSNAGVTGILAGDFKIAGGCRQSGSVKGSQIPSVTGSYTGQLHSASGRFITVTIKADEKGPDARGYYSISGPVTFKGSTCFASGTVTSSAIYGRYIDMKIATDKGDVLDFNGEILPSTSLILDGNYRVTGGTCPDDQGGGALARSAAS